MLNLYPSESPRTQSLPRVEVVIGRGPDARRARTVTPPVFILGTSADCDLVLTDQQFDDYHAYIIVAEDRVMVRQLGGGPEMTVNQRLARWCELFHGDRIRMGPYEFRLRIWPADGWAAELTSSGDQQLADYEAPAALRGWQADQLPAAWSHVLPTGSRFSEW